MLLQDVKKQILQLSIPDRLTLLHLIIDSLGNEFKFCQSDPSENYWVSRRGQETDQKNKMAAIQQLRGCLKTEQSTLTDVKVEAMLEERRFEKYGL